SPLANAFHVGGPQISSQTLSPGPFFFFFWRQGLTLLLRLEWCGTISVHFNTHLPGLSDCHTSASRVAGITGARHCAWLIFVFLVETRFHHVGQAGLSLLTSSYPPVSASQSAGIIGVSCRAQPQGPLYEPFLCSVA
uniref:Uncharacterized protein n=1 Tax=Macaca mulatta TaxID=9544 RepID=A0A5F7ZGA4_MACMU